jgi:YbgC/YbaW family acyl-CoA thioester hydrolase
VNRYLRLLWLALAARRRPPCDVLGPCRTPFRVWPTDLDVLRHVNNGTYLSIMDLARVDLMARSGVLAKLRARGWYPVVGEQSIQYRRSLTLGQPFAVVTRVLGWDERAIVLEQRFVRAAGRDGEDEEVAAAVVRARFLARARGAEPGGPLPTAAVLALAGHDAPSPALPDWVARWVADQTALRAARPGAVRPDRAALGAA